MVRKARTRNWRDNEEIPVSAFRHIQIHFPGDVYILALWIAMSDKAKSTPTCQSHTTLHGLARKFASLYGVNYSHPLSSDDVMAVFRRRGIVGNPVLLLDREADHSLGISQIEDGSRLSAPSRATMPEIAEQPHSSGPEARRGSK